MFDTFSLRTLLIFPAVVVVSALGLLGCDSNTSAIQTCQLQAGPNSKSVPMSVTYDYTLRRPKGKGFTALAYRTKDGLKRVENPEEIASGFNTVFFPNGGTVEIRATVELTSGSARIKYTARDTAGTILLEESDQCDVK